MIKLALTVAGLGALAGVMAYRAVRAEWIEPAARMLWVEHRGGDEEGSPSVPVAEVLFRRARRAQTTPHRVVTNETRSPGDGPWSAWNGYLETYLGAPLRPEYVRAAWLALIASRWGRGPGPRHFTHGGSPMATWIARGFHAEQAGTVGGKPLWMYETP